MAQTRAGAELRGLVLAALMAAVTGALAYVAVPLPFTQVPISGQNLGVMLSGLLLGPWWGGLSMLFYVVLVALGVPIGAKGHAGLAVILGPTGGYLIGFILGAFVVGWFARGRVSLVKYILGCAIGGAGIVYIPGASWLAYTNHLTAGQAVALGVLPFVIGDLIKSVVASVVAVGIERAYPLREIRGGAG
ncbi:MAG: biotin transporter BioY [Alicyclobacillaceae bacterium]|nr:biotin transporter BioY [Alicyclobacillaceae bacterium]